MKTISISKKLSFSKKRLDFALLPVEHDEVEYEYDEIKNSSYVEEEPPAWLDVIAEARYKAWLAGKEKSKPVEVVFQELREELGF